MARKVFKDGLVYGTLINVELLQEADEQGKKVQVWVFTAEMSKGNIHTEGDAVMVERKFYIPANVAQAVEFSNAVGWNKKTGSADAKFSKPEVSCRATFKPANRGKNDRVYPATNDFGELFAVVTENEVNSALAATFGAAAMSGSEPSSNEPDKRDAAAKPAKK